MSPSGELCESVTVDEIMGHFVVTNVPLKILLKDTISECIAEFVDDSIETRFGGVRLPTSIKYTDEVLTHLSNVVAVQIHGGHTVRCYQRSVTHVPVSVVLDGSVHEHFNLTHVVKNVNLFDSFNIEGGESRNHLLCHLVNRGHRTSPRRRCIQHEVSPHQWQSS